MILNDENSELLANSQSVGLAFAISRWRSGFRVVVAMIVFGASTLMSTDLAANDELLVLKTPEILYARSAFSDEYDVVVSMAKGVNDQFDFHEAALVARSAPMTLATCQSADVFQVCVDDAAPWKLNGTYIGANHGWYGVFEMTIPDHGLTTDDLGMPWRDEDDSEFYIIKIVDSDKIWVMPDNTGSIGNWRFASNLNGALENEAGQSLRTEATVKTQLAPACRIIRQDYLVDGEIPLEEGVVTACEFLELVEEYDIVNPAAVIAAVKQNPGVSQDFVAADLDFLLTNEIRYQLQPWGACTVRHKAVINREFGLNLTGFIQTRALLRRDGDIHRYYVPDTGAFTVGGLTYDFGEIQDFPGPPSAPLQFGVGFDNVDLPERQPSRFVQFLSKRSGSASGAEIGYVVGYSLLEGCTVPEVRAANSARAAFIHTSAKTYPIAMDEKIGRIPAGEVFENLAYRQYFSPSALSEKATSAYLHREGDNYLLYVDYHQVVPEDVIELPKFLSGRDVTIVEATPSVELLSGTTVPESGIRLASKDGSGHIAIAIAP